MFFPFNILMAPIRPLMKATSVSYKINEAGSDNGNALPPSSPLETRAQQIENTSM